MYDLFRTSFSISSLLLATAATLAKYMITFFVFSVFPAPDSPLWVKFTRDNNSSKSKQILVQLINGEKTHLGF